MNFKTARPVLATGSYPGHEPSSFWIPASHSRPSIIDCSISSSVAAKEIGNIEKSDRTITAIIVVATNFFFIVYPIRHLYRSLAKYTVTVNH